VEQYFEKVSLGQIKPAGWYKDQLDIQARGITGIIDQYWKDLGEDSGWLGGNGESWERGPYYLDGLVPLAWLLEDEYLILKAKKWIEWTLGSQRADGNFGPPNNDDSWPRSVMLKVLVQYEELSGDKRVLPFLIKYFSFLKDYISREGLHIWGWARGEEFLVTILWAYHRSSELWLLSLAQSIIKASFDWFDYFSLFPYPRPTSFYYDWKTMSEIFPKGEIYESKWYHGTHGVNVAMGFKMALLQAYFSCIHHVGHSTAVDMLLKAIYDIRTFHGTANGMFNCSEHLAGNDPSQGVELCSIVEYMFSLETMLSWCSGVEIADHLETIAYNALPASMTADMSGHQYLQQVNQIKCTNEERHWYNNNADANTFGLEPHFGCCTANLHQGWPKFASSFWMYSSDGGIVASVFSPCTFTFITADKKACTVREITDYPFRGNIDFFFSCENSVICPFKIRIPSWCIGVEIKLPGGNTLRPEAGKYCNLGENWHDGDKVEVFFPFSIRITHWYKNSVSLSYGPLVLALCMNEEWIRLKGDDPFPSWEVRSESPWNYAVILKDNTLPNCRVVYNTPVDAPYSADNSPIIIEVSARRVKDWKEKDNSAGPLPESPISMDMCSGEISKIRLIPYGATKLRIAQFPYVLQE
jgi:hypothetical protein